MLIGEITAIVIISRYPRVYTRGMYHFKGKWTDLRNKQETVLGYNNLRERGAK